MIAFLKYLFDFRKDKIFLPGDDAGDSPDLLIRRADWEYYFVKQEK